MRVFLVTMCEKFESPDPQGVLHTGEVFATLEGAKASAQREWREYYEDSDPKDTEIAWRNYPSGGDYGECGDQMWLVREVELGA